MSKIVTITLNSSIDEYVETTRVEEDGVGEINRRYEVAAGKGVNVSRELKRLGLNSVAYCGTGSDSSDRFPALMLESGIQTEFIVFEGRVRRNITFVDLSGQIPSIHLKGIGYEALDESWFNDLVTRLSEDLAPNDIVSINGSLPKGADVATWQKICKCVMGQRVTLWADISGDPLTCLLDMGPVPQVLKINFAESKFVQEAEVSWPLTTTDALPNETVCICRRLMYLHRLGVRLPIITNGEKGAHFIFDGAIWCAVAPRQKDINRVGAGDAMLAFLLWRSSNAEDIEIQDIVDCVTHAACYVANRHASSLAASGLTKLERIADIPGK